MRTIFRKYLGKSLLPVLLVGTLYACSNDNDPTEGKNGEGKPIELSVSLNAKSNSNTRASENPDDYGQESKIYSLEVFIFKPTGELDGHGLIAPEAIDVASSAPGKYYTKEYREIYEITGVSLTAGQRHLYVIANPPLNGTSSVIKPGLPTDGTSHDTFKTLTAKLQDQGYIASPGNRFDGTDGDPIGGINPQGLQSALTMTAYKDIKFSNEHTKHYLGYNTITGRPDGEQLLDNEYAVTKNAPFQVERLVSRVMLKQVTLPTGPLKADGTMDDYQAYLTSVFMLNVQSGARYYDHGQGAPTGNYVHGYQDGYEFLLNKNLPKLVKDSQLFKPAEPKSTMEEIELRAYEYNVEKSQENSSPIWFYTFENQDSDKPTYMVLEVTYHFNNAGNKKIISYYPVIVNSSGKSDAQHEYILKNYQYEISVNITGLGAYQTAELELNSTRSMDEINWDDVMTVEQTAGRNLFPWTGNVYY